LVIAEILLSGHLVPPHLSEPGRAHLQVTEENTDVQKVKLLGQNHQVRSKVTEPEFRPTSVWNKSLDNFHEAMHV
jgi:hypothetical protein